MSTEAHLAAAVIYTAWQDAAGDVSGSTEWKARQLAQLDGLRFLLNDQGPWATARAIWCDMAGCNADTLRARALRSLPPDARAVWQAWPA